MTRLLPLALLLVGCGGRDDSLLSGSASGSPPPAPDGPTGFVHPPIDAKVVEVAPADWAVCKKAFEAAPKTPPMRRVQTLLRACQPCGDWKPLLEWNKEPQAGGPTRVQIEDAMIACKAYCNADAKQRFLGTLDKFRGQETRGPWRFLGELCKEQVSAVPDNRYVSAAWFALDRIARAAADQPDIAPLLDGFEIPLPFVSISGYGFELAKSPVTAPDAGPLALTVTPAEIRLAVGARARLTKDGLVTLAKGEPYPGALIKTPNELEVEIHKLGEPFTSSTGMAIFAPHGMAATRLFDVLAITGERPRPAPGSNPAKPTWLSGDVRLAVQADGVPGWQLAGSIPVALRTIPVPDAIHVDLDDNPDVVIDKLKADKAKLMAVIDKHKSGDERDDRTTAVVSQDPPTQLWKPALAIHLGPKATVGGLAKVIGASVYFDVKSVALMQATPQAGKPK